MVKKTFWKKQFEEHKFYLGFISGMLMVFLIIFLSLTIALVAQVVINNLNEVDNSIDETHGFLSYHIYDGNYSNKYNYTDYLSDYYEVKNILLDVKYINETETIEWSKENNISIIWTTTIDKENNGNFWGEYLLNFCEDTGIDCVEELKQQT